MYAIRQEAAGALWNLSFDDRNREAIAAAGGVEALVNPLSPCYISCTLQVSLVQECLNASEGLQERAAGALWGLSVSEANSIAIGQGGGVAPLLTLARSEVEDVHETAAGALWNLAFYSGNALRIVEEGGVPVLVHICTSSGSKMARFMSALALAYMFDGSSQSLEVVMQCTTQVSYRKQEQVESCVQRQLQQQLLLKPKFLQESSSGTWSTISQGHQHDSTPSAEVHPPIRHSFTKGCLANAAQLKYQFRHC
ncbi:hypothetical protein PR202_ga07852 [Eleusine coracana subsp. coracana]|uniref:Uncharacterized protein n=1 Tax=Eleusine coracana subsp. coracana TaxID=191504 RepID=A0AAV5BZT6_ELECO|nr:hypothetical protein PR202_ga07852 [Eleusine coracana subsp. coracana]